VSTLESLKISLEIVNMKELLEIIINYSPKKFFQLKLYYDFKIDQQLTSDLLEYFFMNWSNRVPLKPFYLVIIDLLKVNKFTKNSENMEIINNYIKLGVIKRIKVIPRIEN
jgi:hypothetical protein